MEAALERAGQLAGASQMAGVGARLVEVEQRRGEKGVVVEETLLLRPALRPRMEQPALATDLRPQELGRRGSGLEIAWLVEHTAGFGERAAQERVPAGENLVVERRGHAAAPNLEQAAASLGDGRRRGVG